MSLKKKSIAKTESAETESVKIGLGKTEPVKADSGKTDSVKADSGKPKVPQAPPAPQAPLSPKSQEGKEAQSFSPHHSKTLFAFESQSSQQARMETQAAQAQKMQAVGQLAGGVAHDFNNILMAIITACDSLPRGQFSEVAEIRRHAERGSNLVRQLLAFSRQQRLRFELLDLAKQTENICDWLPRLLGAQITLELKSAPAIWQVKGDITQFEQIVVNLAINARDAMPKGGILAITISNMQMTKIPKQDLVLMPVADYVLFEMTDNGSGIARGDYNKIFEPFFSTKKQGSGLGLSTVYGIVKQSGGYIFADSKKNQGTQFRIYLPRHQIEEAQAQAHKAQAELPLGNLPKISKKKHVGKDKHILLVEDEDAIRDFSARALRQQGFKILSARNGEEALEISQHQQIDLLISDIAMPGMDGVRLAQTLLARHAGLKVILISGYAQEAFRDPQQSLPHQIRFLPKPFGLKELILAAKTTLKI